MVVVGGSVVVVGAMVVVVVGAGVVVGAMVVVVVGGKSVVVVVGGGFDVGVHGPAHGGTVQQQLHPHTSPAVQV